MGSDRIKAPSNPYFAYRKRAAKCNMALSSRESAAELLGVSASSLSDYELGNTKVVPPDKVSLMSKLYCAPELRNWYCKNECPIGKELVMADHIGSLEGIALKLLRGLDEDDMDSVKKTIVEIFEDGCVAESEIGMLGYVTNHLKKMQEAISELLLVSEKYGGLRDEC